LKLTPGLSSSAGEACCVQVPDGAAAPVPGGWLRLPPHDVLPQVPGADGVRSVHHGAGGGAVRKSEEEELIRSALQKSEERRLTTDLGSVS